MGSHGGHGAVRLIGRVKEIEAEDQIPHGSRHENKSQGSDANPHPLEGVPHRIHYCRPRVALPNRLHGSAVGAAAAPSCRRSLCRWRLPTGEFLGIADEFWLTVSSPLVWTLAFAG